MMTPKAPKHTADDLRKRLAYSPETGALVWRSKAITTPHDLMWNTRFAGKPAFASVRPDGYLEGHVDGTKYQAHRVAFCIHHGKWPDGAIDHLNGHRADNSAGNIRDTDIEGNNCNRRRSKNNASGQTGVYWNAEKLRYEAQIERGGKRHRLGYFETLEAAVNARKTAESQMGFSHRHGED